MPENPTQRIYKHIDYLQFTTDRPFAHDEKDWTLKKSTMTNYRVMRVLPSGWQCHHGHNKSDRWLNVLSGKVCETIPDMNLFMNNVIKHGAKFSRIDFAVTVENGMTVQDFQSWSQSGKVTGALADAGIKTIVNDKTTQAETTYCGELKKRSKKGIFRAYDKGAEQLLENVKIHRFELEERKDRANTTAKRFADGYDIGDLIRQRVDCSESLWLETMGAKSEKLTRYTSGIEESDIDTTWQWLCTVVAPSLARKIVDDVINQNGSGNITRFEDILEREYRRQLYIALADKGYNVDTRDFSTGLRSMAMDSDSCSDSSGN